MIEFIAFLKPIIHYGLHFVFPGLIAYLFFKVNWKKTWLILILTMLVDLDHLLAYPIFEASRCSINYHPLHTYYAMCVYVVFLYFPKLRVVGIGLLFHMFTDALDCYLHTI